ncbi:uncharacterized protein LOC132379690 [Hypanus sabinus]|uniref:uncharacterized protein LOC132379690 n=1 Tax=Hypanus sabinus TaxID=79690 RepID=UPI0028C43B10|nr:uncharacterized protein LOC132379690 [Hypanus sabinus]
MNLVFQVLEDLLPELGIYTSVLNLIRDELYDGVYSIQHPGNSGPESGIAGTATRAPYFRLFHCLQEKRNEEVEAISTELNDLREILLQKEHEQIELQNSLSELKKSNKLPEDHTFFLNENVHEKTEENKRLLQKYHNVKEKTAKQARCYEDTIKDLRTMLQDTTEQVAALIQYKKIYEDLHEGFQYPMEMQRKSSLSTILTKAPGNKKMVKTANKAHLVSCIEATKQFEHQVLKVQNSVIEDFDLHLESHKTWLASKMFQNNRADLAYCDETLEMQTINKEFAEKQQIFQQSMAEIATELVLVYQHKESLQQQLNEQEKTPKQKQKKTTTLKTTQVGKESRPAAVKEPQAQVHFTFDDTEQETAATSTVSKKKEQQELRMREGIGMRKHEQPKLQIPAMIGTESESEYEVESDSLDKSDKDEETNKEEQQEEVGDVIGDLKKPLVQIMHELKALKVIKKILNMKIMLDKMMKRQDKMDKKIKNL